MVGLPLQPIWRNIVGTYVRVNFVLQSDVPGNYAMSDKPGWYIDDVSIGEKYAQDGTMVIKNIQPRTRYMKKSQPNGYGIIVTDSFEPGISV